MFDSLSERLNDALGDVRSRGTLTEDDVNKAMRQVRLALLEADVNFKVVKQFTSAVKERATGSDVLDALNPGQQVVKIVSDELTELMGGAGRDLVFASSGGPTVILMAGLQGSGKTTACGKLAQHLKEEKKLDVALAACDLQRPAAVDQLKTVGARAGATVYEQGVSRNPVDVAEWALGQAKADRRDVLIVDTAGRLHVDAELMDELVKVKKAVKPHDVVLVVDAMTGQDAVNVAESFAEATDFDGVILSKLDGDARGGAALSVKALTGKPILVRLDRREAGRLRALPPRPDGPAHPRHGRRDDPDREGRGSDGRAQGPGAREEDPQEPVHAGRLPRPDEAGAQHGPALRPAEDDPRHGCPDGQPQRGRQGARPPRGHHHLDDPGRARQPQDHQRLAPQADRRGLGHQRPGRLPPGQAVRPDAEDDAPALQGQDARPAAAGRRQRG